MKSITNILQLWLSAVIVAGIAVNAYAADSLGNLADWPMFQYNAQHTGFNDHASLHPPLMLRWEKDVFDSANYLAELAVVDDRVFVSHTDGPGWNGGWDRYLRCLDARSGGFLWDHFFPASDMVYAPAAGYGNVYVQADYGSGSFLTALEPTTGATRWTTYYSEQGARRFSPTLHDGYLVSTGGTYQGSFCVNAYTGEPYWWYSGGLDDYVAPAAFRDKVYFFSGGYLIAYDLASGTFLWNRYVYDTMAVQPTADPQFFMGTVPVIDTIHHAAYLMWHLNVTAVDLDSHDILWQRWGDFGKTCHGITPALAYDQLFVVDSGVLKSLDCVTGEELWRFEADSGICFPPVVANGYVYVSASNCFHAVNIASHQSEFTGSYGHTGRLAVARDKLYVATQTGIAVCYRTWGTDVEDEPLLSSEFTLQQNYPNPFNSSTIIAYTLPRQSAVTLAVYDILGRSIRMLVDRTQPSGNYSVKWDGCDASGRPVSSGIYLYRLLTDKVSQSRKLMLLK